MQDRILLLGGDMPAETEGVIEEQDIPPEPADTARPMEPVKFFGPHGDPAANRDFRPSVVTNFKDDEEEYIEDGHGHSNIMHQNEPVHPTVKRRGQPYMERDPRPVVQDEPTSEDEPTKAPGIAGAKQVQPSEE